MRNSKKISVGRFDYRLPKNLIGQKPIKPRDSARLLVLDKKTGQIQHQKFWELEKYLNPGDVLVLNNSKVIPARLLGKKEIISSPPAREHVPHLIREGVRGGGRVEIFLLQKRGSPPARELVSHLMRERVAEGRGGGSWQTLIKGKIKPNQKIILPKNITAQIIEKCDDQTWLVKFNASDKKLFTIGQTPLPPYIKNKSKMNDYQTVYAKSLGSVAAPTAGLHFTKRLISRLKKKGVKIEYITLHVGLGTFLPVKTEYIQEHKMHSEFAVLTKQTANRLNQAKKSGYKIVAVGTTSARTLEALANTDKKIIPQSAWIDFFIYSGYNFKFVDALITNFHLPKSTLLMLVSAFIEDVSPCPRACPALDAGGSGRRPRGWEHAYQEAIKKKYRFYSFGDAMLIY